MFKKYLVTTVAMLAAVSMLAACANKNNNETTPTVTVAPTEAPSSEERGDGPTLPTEAPTVAPTEAPEATVDHNQMIQNVAQFLKESFGSMYVPDMQMQEDAAYMQDTLGLDASWYDAAYVEVPMMSFGADKFIMIHPTEGNLENVQNAMESYKQAQIADTFQYPSTMTQRQAALVATIGDYVCYMIFTGFAGDLWEMDEASQIQAYAEANDQVKQMIAAVVSGEITVTPWTEFDKMRNEIVKWYGTTYYPNVKVHQDEAYLATYLADTLKMDAAWVEDIIIEVPMISANADTLILVDPTEGNAENVLKALQDYKTYLVEEAFQYPMNAPRVKTAAVAKVGDYVCFSILGGAVDNPAEWGITTDEELEQYYESMNMNAIYALQSYLGVEE